MSPSYIFFTGTYHTHALSKQKNVFLNSSDLTKSPFIVPLLPPHPEYPGPQVLLSLVEVMRETDRDSQRGSGPDGADSVGTESDPERENGQIVVPRFLVVLVEIVASQSLHLAGQRFVQGPGEIVGTWGVRDLCFGDPNVVDKANQNRFIVT